jgi:hypothetical protein
VARAAKLQPGMNSTGPPLRASMRCRVLTTTTSAVASPSRRPTRSSDPGSPDMGERRWDVKATFVKLCSTRCAPARVRHWRIAATVSPPVSDGRAVYGVQPLADQFSKNHDEQL